MPWTKVLSSFEAPIGSNALEGTEHFPFATEWIHAKHIHQVRRWPLQSKTHDRHFHQFWRVCLARCVEGRHKLNVSICFVEWRACDRIDGCHRMTDRELCLFSQDHHISQISVVALSSFRHHTYYCDNGWYNTFVFISGSNHVSSLFTLVLYKLNYTNSGIKILIYEAFSSNSASHVFPSPAATL